MLWWVNRALHLFGWALVAVVETDGSVSSMYPARTVFRGFSMAEETEGFTALTKHLQQNAEALVREVEA
jgi:hypothetical protein